MAIQANSSSSKTIDIYSNTSCASALTSEPISVVKSTAYNLGIGLQIDSGTAAGLVCKVQQLIIGNWVDVAGWATSSITAAGSVIAWSELPCTGILRVVITPTTPSSLKVSARLYWSEQGK
jgi:hypothetical protein